MEWDIKPYDDLSTDELYEMLQLRVNVFVVEQMCAYPELDGKDKRALHLTCTKEGAIVAYARLFPTHSLDEKFAFIGRVIVASKERGTGLGRQLLERGIQYVERTEKEPTIKIHAQIHLTSFYEQSGFVVSSDPYDEDGISHVDMIRKGGRDNFDA